MPAADTAPEIFKKLVNVFFAFCGGVCSSASGLCDVDGSGFCACTFNTDSNSDTVLVCTSSFLSLSMYWVLNLGSRSEAMSSRASVVGSWYFSVR